MIQSLEISVESVERANAIVKYSDKISTLLHQYTHSKCILWLNYILQNFNYILHIFCGLGLKIVL